MKNKLISIFICVICVPLLANANTVSTASFREEVNTFLGKELAAHLAAIKSLDPPPERILGVQAVMTILDGRIVYDRASTAAKPNATSTGVKQ